MVLGPWLPLGNSVYCLGSIVEGVHIVKPCADGPPFDLVISVPEYISSKI